MFVYEDRVVDQYFSTKDAAKYLGVSPNWLRDHWVSLGLKPKNIARPGAKTYRWRYKKADLDRWAEKREFTFKY